ncbi:MAG: phosphoribosyl-ATP pyrophosphohydrolase [Methylobacteriaceae bacterium]|jgi:phosphoribosyl-ATP pyrophosphohydrolase|nr:phosphoribosyl-ATP pyrophosphohydrolase [Methylobacteriaceae bacterium]
MSRFSLDHLAAIIAARAGATAEQSYTKSLLEAGPARAAKKFGEEAIEAVIAAIEGDRTALIKESADVVYHLIVLLKTRGISLDEVMEELQRRTGQSGHAEKAGRGS